MQAVFRFYGGLNDFVSLHQRQRDILYTFQGAPAVKDAIEALGVPHTAVRAIVSDGRGVGFAHRLQPGVRVAVYPAFAQRDLCPVPRLGPPPEARPSFVLDVHLGKLARLLRMLGLDVAYRNDYADDELVTVAEREGRTLLTRDRGLLKRGALTRGYWVRATMPLDQAREIVRRYRLHEHVRPFTRCMRCNGRLVHADQEMVRDQVPPRTAAWCETYYRCSACGHVYWAGTHVQRMRETVARILAT
jgi:uncharacterized protein with PIN domain